MPSTDETFSQQRQNMVQQQIKARGIKDSRILSALTNVARHAYVPQSRQRLAYNDGPLPIGHQQTISQPYIVAYMTALLAPKAQDTILEIGTGSGYQTAILSLLCKHVFTIEFIPQLALKAKQINDASGYKNITYLSADGSMGWPAQIQFDAIMVTAAAPLTPQPLLQQLKPFGRMLIPVGERFQQLLQYWQHVGDEFVKHEYLSVMFVPLKGQQGWQ
ncbi:MAG: protein-L-isoaspartate(D-aspartate) O-methyltransferase [Anaerolineaceae bacterium]|nr:protein-L-isoaspartate(D-aspartate) O-methyltransferase [Anaerolineaceae bacterium]